jgi:uncharacterized protein
MMAKNLLMASVTLLSTAGCAPIERMLLYYPTHHASDNGLSPWTHEGKTIGNARPVESPSTVWLMLHGNGGQAADRVYALPCFSENDSVYILEYPGYGRRGGTPSKASLNQAAKEAYLLLRDTHPRIPVCVAAESIGSGPALSLASLDTKPDKFTLVVPFDTLSNVAERHFPRFLVRLILRDNWDNITALANYDGPVEIFGAENDTIVPINHAHALAASYPKANMKIIPGGHNEWSHEEKVQFRYP